MTNPYTPNNATTARFDWTRLAVQAERHGSHAFLETMSRATSGMDESQLQADEYDAVRRFAQAIDLARRDRLNFASQVLSAIRNWSRKQAIVILRQTIAGVQIPPDFYPLFQFDLQQEISTMILDLQLFWEEEDEQRAAEKQEEAERAYGAAYPYILGLNNAILQGERQRQMIFNDGQNAVNTWADKYERSVNKREELLEEREKLIQEQEQENRAHQLALRSLAKWDDRNSFANTMVSTGKNTIGCLFIWFLLVGGILLAIYFAFPHH